MNEEALAQWGLSRQKQTNDSSFYEVKIFYAMVKNRMCCTSVLYVKNFKNRRLKSYITCMYTVGRGPGSSVGIATELRAGRSGDRIPVGARFSAPVQTGPGAHPASCTMGTGSFPGVKSGRGVTLTPHPF